MSSNRVLQAAIAAAVFLASCEPDRHTADNQATAPPADTASEVGSKIASPEPSASEPAAYYEGASHGGYYVYNGWIYNQSRGTPLYPYNAANVARTNAAIQAINDETARRNRQAEADDEAEQRSPAQGSYKQGQTTTEGGSTESESVTDEAEHTATSESEEGEGHGGFGDAGAAGGEGG